MSCKRCVLNVPTNNLIKQLFRDSSIKFHLFQFNRKLKNNNATSVVTRSCQHDIRPFIVLKAF